MNEEITSAKGMQEVELLYHNRSKRARELSRQGKKIIGYFCSYTPVEIITAANLVPWRIMGETTGYYELADSRVESILCPYVRSCFNLAMRGDLDFLDGFVTPHACDNIQKIFDIWRAVIKPTYAHFVNVPHTVTKSTFQFFKYELENFERSLFKAFGKEVTPNGLKVAIEQHNENRKLIRQLYSLRKPDPPLLSGSEMIKILVNSVSLPVVEANDMLKDIIDQVKHRSNSTMRHRARILIQGAEMDDSSFIDMVEELGASVVVDDLCTGTRTYWNDIEITPDPLDGLATRYLERINCPRTFRPRAGNYEEDLETRFSYLRKLIEDFSVEGVILNVMRYCDIFGFDVPDIEHYLQQMNIPVLYLEDSYNVNAIGQMKTRVQAFLEMLA